MLNNTNFRFMEFYWRIGMSQIHPVSFISWLGELAQLFLQAVWRISNQTCPNSAFVEMRAQEAAECLVGENVVLGVGTN